VALMDRALDAWSAGTSDPSAPAGPGRNGGFTLLVLAGIAGLIIAAVLRVPGIRIRQRPETASWRALRAAYARAGWDADPLSGALDFARGLAAREAPGHPAALRAVRHYLAARFGAGDPAPERARLATAAHEARAALRAAVRRDRPADPR
jgi:hypothetical protein